jgi:paired small multidrug resistance pump
MLNLHWWDFVGFVGVVMVLGAYFALQTRKMRGDGIPFSLLNALGAGCILVPVWYAPVMNWSVLFIEGVWILISFYGIWHSLTNREKAPPPVQG